MVEAAARRRTSAATCSALVPSRAASAPDSTAKPAPMPTVRLSTTITGTSTVPAAISAALQVPEIRSLRCTDTMAE